MVHYEVAVYCIAVNFRGVLNFIIFVVHYEVAVYCIAVNFRGVLNFIIFVVHYEVAVYCIAVNFRGVLNFIIFVVHRIFFSHTRMRDLPEASHLKSASFRWYRTNGHHAVSAEEQSTN